MALDYGLRDRVVLVTGAASGIGRATAELLAGMGAAVVASDIDADAGASAAAALADAGARVRFVAADVAEEDGVAAVVADAQSGFGAPRCGRQLRRGRRGPRDDARVPDRRVG